MAVVEALQGETRSSLQAEEAILSACKGDLAAVDGSFNFILADLKSACFLPTCSEGPEGQDLVVGENGGGAVPSLDEAMGEGEVSIPDDDQGQDLGLLLALRGAMTNSTYVSCYSFDLIPYRFKVRDSNELGGRLYRLDLHEEYVFEKMLMRMIVPFFIFETRISFMRCLAGNSFLGVFPTSRNAKG
ncbi:hypothetical protein F2Q70_00004805 [Brassica cretica]|nr:hypothetical protein F2Q68_00021590 [Brassica cretica]KAF2575898.1 hypothetical protein F2Q70_00004805 [Brassica cretica]